ncbi:lipopolysaccharide biosynthesis protein [Phragmitibacter flavus]|uniref:Lipopolysaccharide biosynthesis protein n=1 Tax=Phragmitibacter flavus TaxID=2576071 RepID=A0A5R8K7X5_9BACT|nr:glycoside hydrolase family 99-like domain-containing protein [Phragmitibacter flavus]TLD68431.1 lipopolysaccharide biosynthesis protein [Phragmitibacter flavus]
MTAENKRARLVAFYLPQFHPIAENDEWWGKGFTEWTDVAKAKPLFPGHYQPRIPADLGFYDLRLPETRAAQADLARKAGIEGFCYWHYWFGGRRIMERPFNEVLKSGEPDFPFCLAWANHSWYGKQGCLIEQTYPGKADYEAHFYNLLPAFQDPRYIRVDNKPLFYVFSAWELPDADEFLEFWQELAVKNGLDGIHFVARCSFEFEYTLPRSLSKGFAAFTYSHENRIASFGLRQVLRREFWKNGEKLAGGVDQSTVARSATMHSLRKVIRRAQGRPLQVFDYAEALPYLRGMAGGSPRVYPSVVPNWDHSPRSGGGRTILHNSTPELFRKHLNEVLEDAEVLPAAERIVFVKSWNEWAEGNYLEPDRRFGHQYLDVVREEIHTEPQVKSVVVPVLQGVG